MKKLILIVVLIIAVLFVLVIAKRRITNQPFANPVLNIISNLPVNFPKPVIIPPLLPSLPAEPEPPISVPPTTTEPPIITEPVSPIKNNPNLSTQTIDILTDSVIGPADNRLQGFIHGLSYDSSKDYTATLKLLSALRPQSWRMSSYGNNAIYNFVISRAKFSEKYQTKIVYNLADTFNSRYGFPLKIDSGCRTSGKGCFTDYAEMKKAWASHMQDFMTRAVAGNVRIDYYDLLSEPNWGWEGVNGVQILDLFKTSYAIVKSNQPNAKIVGPSLSFYSEKALAGFIDYVKLNNLKLDAISWHELDVQMDGQTPIYPEVAYDHILAVQKMLKDKLACGNNCPEIHLNEYNWKVGYFEPGWALGWLHYFTKAGVDQANRACWGGAEGASWDSCWSMFGGLLSEDNQKTENLYWVYKAYADLSGKVLNVKSSNPRTVALASFDSVKNEMQIIAGRYAQNTSANLVLTINASPFLNKKVSIDIKKIPNPGNKISILTEPVAVANYTETITSATQKIVLGEVKDGEVYLVNIVLQ